MTEPTELADAAPRTSMARVSLTLLLLINLLNYIDRYVLAAVEPNISNEFFGKHAAEGVFTGMGLLGTAFIISYMIAAPIFGWLADRMSRWLLVGIGVLLWSAATAAGGLAPTFIALLITRMFVGIGEGGYGPAAPTIISDLFPVQRRGTVLAWFYVAIPVGSAMGYVIGGAIGGTSLGWRWAFYVVTLPGIILGLWSLFMKDPPRRSAGGGEGGSHTLPTWSDYKHLIRIRSYVLNSFAMAAMTFASGGMAFWMPKYLTQIRHLPESSKIIFGGITAAAGLTSTILGGLAGDALRRRFGGAYFLVSGFGIFLAAPFILLMLWTPFPASYVLLFFAIFFLFFNTGPSNTALANVVAPGIRASAFAVNIFVIHLLGDASSPPALEWVAAKFGWNAAFEVVAGFVVLAGALWLVAAPHLKADTEAAERSPLAS